MQKKLIALAVAGLVAAPAMAQSNVTIYGLVDVGVSHRSDNIAPGVGSKFSVDSGIQSGNRLGFKGTEDLGNGLKAGFVLETGFGIEQPEFRNGSPLFGRQAFVTLSGGFGTLAVGRVYTPQFNLLSSVDPFGFGTVGEMNNLYQTDVRVDNTVAYISPSFSGLTVTAAYVNHLAGAETAGNDNDTRVFALSPVYKNGPILLGLNYHKIDPQAAGAASLDVWDIAGSYDFGVAKVAAAYGNREVNATDERNSWMLGVTVPVSGAGRVLASYNYTKRDVSGTSVDPKSTQWAIGYEHDLSKRTNLYVAYADISNKKGATASVGDSSNGGAGYQNGFNIGIRHKF
ncbi:porin [Hydrogenophilus thiooxidans]|uniref:porin n=1 Tax=Hydrogenophilus thiooxidans TaxID=2820326 RepID=UPI001C24DD4B|nr:porin [Hydrogenophilus thiooxidans]